MKNFFATTRICLTYFLLFAYHLLVESWVLRQRHCKSGLYSIEKEIMKKNEARLYMKFEEKNENIMSTVVESRNIEEKTPFNPVSLLDPGTRGGLVVWGSVLTLGPLGFYNWYTSINPDSVTAGAYVGSILVFLICIMWTSSYLFRVANKDTTYAKQLRDYEEAVLRKRFGELNDEEISAILNEIESEKQKTKRKV